MARSYGLDFTIQNVEPTQIVLIPSSCRYEHRGIFVFAHDRSDPEFLPRKLMLLQQVIDLATAKIDNILLLDELQRMNLELEVRVQERTVDLHRTTLKLETEIAEREYAERVVLDERHRLRTVLENLPDSEILVHGISISPGKPTILAKAGHKPFWGLPGHVVSAMVVFQVVVLPFLNRLRGLARRAI